jgi:hypothetical protein
MWWIELDIEPRLNAVRWCAYRIEGSGEYAEYTSAAQSDADSIEHDPLFTRLYSQHNRNKLDWDDSK